MTIRPEHLDAAMLAADPTLKRRRDYTAGLDDVARNMASYLAESRTMEDSARVRVRRVVAALNGIDVERNVAEWSEPPVILSRAFAERLKAALLNRKACDALDATLGVERVGTARRDRRALARGESS